MIMASNATTAITPAPIAIVVVERALVLERCVKTVLAVVDPVMDDVVEGVAEDVDARVNDDDPMVVEVALN